LTSGRFGPTTARLGRGRPILVGLLAVVGSGAPIAAQAPSPPVPAPLVLYLPASTRMAGMGGAGVAVIGDAGAMAVNPSGLALVKTIAVEGIYGWLPGGVEHRGAAGALRLGQFNLGASYQFLRYPEPSPAAHDLLWTAGAVYRYGLVAVGAALKYAAARDRAGALAASTAGDVGVTLAVFDIMALAASVQNLADRAASGPGVGLPTMGRLGFTLNFVDPQSNARLLGTIETVWVEGESRRTVLGAEGGVVVHGVGVVARVGHGGQFTALGQTEWTVGGSVVLGQLHLDYAYQQQRGSARDIHRVGVRWAP